LAAKLDSEARDLKMPSAEAMARTTVPLDAELQSLQVGGRRAAPPGAFDP
jgi:hypothetical protein